MSFTLLFQVPSWFSRCFPPPRPYRGIRGEALSERSLATSKTEVASDQSVGVGEAGGRDASTRGEENMNFHTIRAVFIGVKCLSPVTQTHGALLQA